MACNVSGTIEAISDRLRGSYLPALSRPVPTMAPILLDRATPMPPACPHGLVLASRSIGRRDRANRPTAWRRGRRPSVPVSARAGKTRRGIPRCEPIFREPPLSPPHPVPQGRARPLPSRPGKVTLTCRGGSDAKSPKNHSTEMVRVAAAHAGPPRCRLLGSPLDVPIAIERCIWRRFLDRLFRGRARGLSSLAAGCRLQRLMIAWKLFLGPCRKERRFAGGRIPACMY